MFIRKLKIVFSQGVRSTHGDMSNDGENAVLIAFNRVISPLEAAGIRQFVERGLSDA